MALLDCDNVTFEGNMNQIQRATVWSFFDWRLVAGPALESLTLGYSKLHDIDFLELLAASPNLQRLEIVWAQFLKLEPSFMANQERLEMRWLQRLRILGADVTPQGLEALVVVCPRLKHLEIVQCPRVNHDSLTHISPNVEVQIVPTHVPWSAINWNTHHNDNDGI